MLRDDALYRLGELASQYTPTWDAATQIKAWGLYCDALVNAGYVALLADANPQEFAIWMARAGTNWHVLLQRAKRQGFAVPASYNQALLARLAIDDLAGANSIVQLSAQQRIEPEYEDEFLHSHLFQTSVAILTSGDWSSIAATTMRPHCEALASAAPDARATIWRAMIDGDAPRFWDAIDIHGEAYREQLTANSQDPAADYFSWRAARNLWLEGLAFCRIARHLAFGTPPQPIHCVPALVLPVVHGVDDGRFLLSPT